MSDDWAKNYIGVHKQKQQERENNQRRADLAAAGAPDMFQRIKERVQRDLQTFHGDGVLQNLQMENWVMTGKFGVLSQAPYVEGLFAHLEVELSIVLIKYTYFFRSKEKKIEQKPGALRIDADLHGEIRVRRNGETFTDESEVSEFLLRPLLDFVDG